MMLQQKVEDVKDVALKLDEIRNSRPEDYFYLKGWIHCLVQKENKAMLSPASRQRTGPHRAAASRERVMSENHPLQHLCW